MTSAPPRLSVLIGLYFTACSLETPCPSGQRLAENQRDGATIRYCVALADGRAYGEFTCTMASGAGVTGRFDRNRKIGAWKYYHQEGELLRTEEWTDGRLTRTTAHVQEKRSPLRCGKEVIVATPPKPLQLDKGWSVEDGVHRRLYPNSTRAWMSGSYAQGVKDGEWHYYRRDGTLYMVGTYSRGLVDGIWIEHDENGTPRKRARYRRGELVRGENLASRAASVRGMVSTDPGELTRFEVKRALEEALH
ncbi:MAG: hypothetical protein AAF658_04205 [Myxococcota bacterium]